MSLKFLPAAILLIAAAPALAQPPAAASSQPQAAPAPPTAAQSAAAAAIQPAAMAFGQCVSGAVPHVDASVTPEAGATNVLNGCSTQRHALDQAVEALLATLPADQQAAGRAQYQSQIGAAQTQIADAIRQSRAAPATPATPATPPH